MSKSKFIADYIIGERVNETFLLTQKQLCISKNGKEYLSVKLVDKTGEIDGKKWETTESEYDNLIEGGFYNIKGTITEFNGKQLRIDSLVRTVEDYNPEDFLQCSPRDTQVMKKETDSFIKSISDENCKKLLKYFFDNPSFYKKFTEYPAAKSFHHNYVAGLMEHTIETCKIADNIVKAFNDENSEYNIINRDILITGALLHDIGKIKEYEYKAGIEITSEGNLLGHLVMGSMMIEEAQKELNLDKVFIMHMEHMILSHHGKFEYGSPKLPGSLEALLLHNADNLSFIVSHFKNLCLEEDSDDLFTKKVSATLGTRLFKGYINEYFDGQREEEDKKKLTDDFLNLWK